MLSVAAAQLTVMLLVLIAPVLSGPGGPGGVVSAPGGQAAVAKLALVCAELRLVLVQAATAIV